MTSSTHAWGVEHQLIPMIDGAGQRNLSKSAKFANDQESGMARKVEEGALEAGREAGVSTENPVQSELNCTESLSGRQEMNGD